MLIRSLTLSAILVCQAGAFSVVVGPSTTAFRKSALFSTVEDETTTTSVPGVEEAKASLVAVCERIKSENGVIVVDKNAKDELKQAVAELEAAAMTGGFENDDYKDLFLGDWTLLCTTSTSQDGIDTSRIPEFLKDGPLSAIRNSILKTSNKYLNVVQRIRSDGEEEADASSTINRVDHVIEYKPPGQLQDVLDNLPDQLTSLNINPLHVSKSKLVLIHKASIESEAPLRTRLSLNSIVLNVAGTSTFLDPTGKDIAGIRVPLGDFVNTGEFETTFMDEEIRISRGKQGFIDQLRVFTKVKEDVVVVDEPIEPEIVMEDEPEDDSPNGEPEDDLTPSA